MVLCDYSQANRPTVFGVWLVVMGEGIFQNNNLVSLLHYAVKYNLWIFL